MYLAVKPVAVNRPWIERLIETPDRADATVFTSKVPFCSTCPSNDSTSTVNFRRADGAAFRTSTRILFFRASIPDARPADGGQSFEYIVSAMAYCPLN